MNPDYLQLAKKRVQTHWKPYQHPEDFGYDFRDWVSPYTKGAHNGGGLFVVLQDWASADGLSGPVNKGIQELGRIDGLLTNRRLEAALRSTMNLQISETYVTNVFPFVKPGGMSAPIPMADLTQAAERFTKPEITLARPRVVIALGRKTRDALQRVGIDAIDLPHPAARGMSTGDYCELWRKALA